MNNLAIPFQEGTSKDLECFNAEENQVSNFIANNADNLKVNEEVVNNNLVMEEDIHQTTVRPLAEKISGEEVVKNINPILGFIQPSLDAAQNNLVHYANSLDMDANSLTFAERVTAAIGDLSHGSQNPPLQNFSNKAVVSPGSAFNLNSCSKHFFSEQH